jgi:hypothetical protein
MAVLSFNPCACVRGAGIHYATTRFATASFAHEKADEERPRARRRRQLVSANLQTLRHHNRVAVSKKAGHTLRFDEAARCVRRTMLLLLASCHFAANGIVLMEWSLCTRALPHPSFL